MNPHKIAALASYYPNYLYRFYAKRPFLRQQSFAEQQKTLFDDFFGWSDFLPRNFRKLGHQATQILANAEILQRKWATEHRKSFPKNDWVLEITIAQLKEFV